MFMAWEFIGRQWGLITDKLMKFTSDSYKKIMFNLCQACLTNAIYTTEKKPQLIFLLGVN